MKLVAIIWGWLLFGSFATEIIGGLFLNNERMAIIGAGGAFLCLGLAITLILVGATIAAIGPNSEG